MTIIDRCEICGNTKLVSVLDLGKHPLCDDLVPVGSERTCETYPIEILFCEKCCSAHQKYQVNKEILFPDDYHYRSRFTKDVLAGMNDLVDSCEKKFGCLQGKTVVDVGCNDGSLLSYFRDRGCGTVGVEPTGACFDAEQKGHKVYKEYFTIEVARRIRTEVKSVDFIVFTNVFAHIEDLPSLIAAVQELMTENTVIIIENHYLGEILARFQFDTFYHEHPRTYSLRSFQFIAASLGMGLLGLEFPKRYGGNIRVFIGAAGEQTEAISNELEKETAAVFFQGFSDMNAFIENWKKDKCSEIERYMQQFGKLRAKAFPGRAAILVRLLGLNEHDISAVYEKPGSMKIGNYVPGTRIEIHSDEELFAMHDQEQPILNLAWHIRGEIEKYLMEQGYRGKVLHIL